MLSALRTDNSPFNESQLKQLKSSIGSLNPAQSQWLSGYLAGRWAEADSALEPQAVAQNCPVLSILYGSETGNGEAIASTLAETAQLQGLNTELRSLDNFRPAGLRKLQYVAIVMSTHGEGDPPEEALELFEYLEGEQAAKLSGLNYRILALGDRSYPLFCHAGRQLDEHLRSLGAQSFGERVECDIDYDADASAWSDQVIQYALENLSSENSEPVNGSALTTHLSVVPSQTPWSRQQPFDAELTRVQKITAIDSDKDVFHLELSLEDSGMQYRPGDSLGVWASNDPQLVDQVLEHLKIKPKELVQINRQKFTITEALRERLEITRLTKDTVRNFAASGNRNGLKSHFFGLNPDQQQQFVEQRQLVDLTSRYPGQLRAQDLVDLLRPLTPRSYSIASSQQMVEEEVHLTVATLKSDAIGVSREGITSGFLNHRLGAGGQVGVFLEPNRRFRLPEAPESPIIMIAAGTGIAPYRAFMQELESQPGGSVTPRSSWLIFGNPHLRTDFLYQKEWLRWREAGLLNRIDTAWSRDQAEKRYVHHVILEQAERIDRWLQRGAHIYLCGSLHMGESVQQALLKLLTEQRGLEPAAASELVSELRRDRRIQKDLY